MKKKLIALLALCVTFNAAYFAEKTKAEAISEESTQEVTETVEAGFTLVIETVTEDVTEIAEDITEAESEIEAEDMPESVPTEEVSEAVTEVETEVEEATEAELVEILLAEVDEISITGEIAAAEINVRIDGSNLDGKYASITVRQINEHNELLYLRSVVLEDSDSNEINIILPENTSGIYRIDVNAANVKRATKVLAIGESSDDELKCEIDKKDVVLSGKSSMTGEKSVAVKIVNDNGEIVFLKQTKTAEDGSFSINASLPALGNKYVAWVTVDGESGGYVKNIELYTLTSEKHNGTYTLSGNEGDVVNVLVFGKNLVDKYRYIYEIEYPSGIDIWDLCALTREKETCSGYTENGKIEILSVDDGKIRFAVENGSEYDGVRAWSGLVNIISFKKNTDDAVTITMRVYE